MTTAPIFKPGDIVRHKDTGDLFTITKLIAAPRYRWNCYELRHVKDGTVYIWYEDQLVLASSTDATLPTWADKMRKYRKGTS